ncbi:MAG: hypothetical protein VR72_03885 [Clostridiaceae bacterium BRH_c20a]|nr:MAG: hypothetical protein VR72_03885 [Clostridiaceae bacterium BRH_c20a]
MSLADKLLRDFKDLPKGKKKEVIDFVEFLKTKEKENQNKMMDTINEENRDTLEELSKLT